MTENNVISEPWLKARSADQIPKQCLWRYSLPVGVAVENLCRIPFHNGKCEYYGWLLWTRTLGYLGAQGSLETKRNVLYSKEMRPYCAIR